MQCEEEISLMKLDALGVMAASAAGSDVETT